MFLKRLTVWFVETLCGALLLGLFSAILMGPTDYGFARSFSFFTGGVILISSMTGYALTTLICRLVWKRQKVMWYPQIAASLSIIHGLGFFVVADPGPRSGVLLGRSVWLMAGGFVAFVSTLAGSYFLRGWELASKKDSVGSPSYPTLKSS
jgi:hypothetical protein